MRTVLTSSLLILIAIAAHASAPSVNRCERAAAIGLRQCIAQATRCDACAATGSCGPCDDVHARALSRLDGRVRAACDQASLVALGFGPLATPGTVSERLQSECTAEAASLFARTYGGPQAAALTGATDDGRACLGDAYRAAATELTRIYDAASRCIRNTRRRGAGACDVERVKQAMAKAEAEAEAAAHLRCADLRSLIGLDPDVFAARGAQQARCLLASGHGSSTPLTLDCGPRDAAPPPPRGQWVQVVLDGSVWGTQCGDGSPYAFWLRLAPEGSPLENVLVHLQGGGVCVFESDCDAASPSLFEAQSDYQPSGPTGGIFSTNPADNPFANYTMMALPYCTQDVFIGGGGTSDFPSITVQRFGAVDLRASMQYLRDALWAALEASSAEGYRPDRPRVLFVGESAGGFGVMYNYHYVLDDLQWSHTTAVPDSSLALNSHAALNVGLLGSVLSGDTGAFGWKLRRMQPPYCIADDCGLGPVLMTATAPRLKAVPEQQMLSLSNQNDQTQVETTFFPSTQAWITELRARYCDLQGLNGIRFFLPADTDPIHTMLSNSRYGTLAAGGVTVRDFLAAAVAHPDDVVDHVDEGTIAATFGVPPFACLQ